MKRIHKTKFSTINFLFLNGKNIFNNNNNKDMPKIQTTKRIVEFDLSIFYINSYFWYL